MAEISDVSWVADPVCDRCDVHKDLDSFQRVTKGKRKGEWNHRCLSCIQNQKRARAENTERQKEDRAEEEELTAMDIREFLTILREREDDCDLEALVNVGSLGNEVEQEPEGPEGREDAGLCRARANELAARIWKATEYRFM